jgi:hypothetical protein
MYPVHDGLIAKVLWGKKACTVFVPCRGCLYIIFKILTLCYS